MNMFSNRMKRAKLLESIDDGFHKNMNSSITIDGPGNHEMANMRQE